MAPRGRSRKPIRGQTRMDAALDAMKIYGFAEELISSSVKELLDVYGADGWRFIEEDCYYVLLEKILEKVKNEAGEKEGNDNGEDASQGSPPKPSSSVSVPTFLDEEANAMASNIQSNIALDNTVQLGSEPTGRSEHDAHLSHFEESSWKDINIDRDSSKKEIANAEETDRPKPPAIEKPGITCPPLRPDKQEPVRPTRRRKPCYGWISSSDDESDIVELTPAPLPDKLANLLSVTSNPRIRKRRWDANSEDK